MSSNQETLDRGNAIGLLDRSFVVSGEQKACGERDSLLEGSVRCLGRLAGPDARNEALLTSGLLVRVFTTAIAESHNVEVAIAALQLGERVASNGDASRGRTRARRLAS